jgi:hypothetical protein
MRQCFNWTNRDDQGKLVVDRLDLQPAKSIRRCSQMFRSRVDSGRCACFCQPAGHTDQQDAVGGSQLASACRSPRHDNRRHNAGSVCRALLRPRRKLRPCPAGCVAPQVIPTSSAVQQSSPGPEEEGWRPSALGPFHQVFAPPLPLRDRTAHLTKHTVPTWPMRDLRGLPMTPGTTAWCFHDKG